MTGQPTTIHWHGMLVPKAMDGVPGMTQGATTALQGFVYEYPVVQRGRGLTGTTPTSSTSTSTSTSTRSRSVCAVP